VSAVSDQETAPALEALNVCKRYRDGTRTVEAVAGVSLAVPAGSLEVLRGPSGSGKTTLLGLLGAMSTPTSGEVRIEGRSVTHLREHHRTALRREKVGFVFQELSLIGGMSVLENVLLPRVPLGGARREDVARARDLLARFGLGPHASSRADRLSGGERQRAAIARALLLGPAVLLLDEPTAHLDSENARSVVDLLAELRAEGTTIVAATHDPRLAEDPRVDRTRTMRDGKLGD
jgi:putative ABC transport system ATP-binding protein